MKHALLLAFSVGPLSRGLTSTTSVRNPGDTHKQCFNRYTTPPLQEHEAHLPRRPGLWHVMNQAEPGLVPRATARDRSH